ncbi:MAG: thioredoxin family protein [Gammaproteobacteria bacterium]
MVATETPPGEPGARAPEFSLPDADGRMWQLGDISGPKGTLVMFICNHCPFVQAVVDRIVGDAAELEGLGVGSVAIMANDIEQYPQDSPANMKRWAEEMHFPFPYLYDDSQAVARAYGAVCTPDFFGYDAGLQLRYRGRLDSGGRGAPEEGAPRELFEAMKQIAATGRGPVEQLPSIGCSIKWR